MPANAWCHGPVHDASGCMMPAGAWCQPVHDASRCMMPIRKSTQSIKQKSIHHQTINQVILFYCFQNKHSLWGCSTPPSNDPFFRMLHVWSKQHSWPMGYERMANLWGPWGFFECLGPPSELISMVSGHDCSPFHLLHPPTNGLSECTNLLELTMARLMRQHEQLIFYFITATNLLETNYG